MNVGRGAIITRIDHHPVTRVNNISDYVVKSKVDRLVKFQAKSWEELFVQISPCLAGFDYFYEVLDRKCEKCWFFTQISQNWFFFYLKSTEVLSTYLHRGRDSTLFLLRKD